MGLFSNDEADARAAAAVTSYGVGTRSYSRSAEKREMDRQRKAVTQKYESGNLKVDGTLPLVCHCRSFHFPHSPEKHKELPRSDRDWRTPEERPSNFSLDTRSR